MRMNIYAGMYVSVLFKLAQVCPVTKSMSKPITISLFYFTVTGVFLSLLIFFFFSFLG